MKPERPCTHGLAQRRSGIFREQVSHSARESDTLLLSLFLNHSRDAWGACHEQGLYFSTARHLRVRRLKALAQFSPQHQRTRPNEGVFQIISAAQRRIKKCIAEISPLGFVLASERRVLSVCRGVGGACCALRQPLGMLTILPLDLGFSVCGETHG